MARHVVCRVEEEGVMRVNKFWLGFGLLAAIKGGDGQAASTLWSWEFWAASVMLAVGLLIVLGAFKEET